jgi:CBS domain-containing protein
MIEDLIDQLAETDSTPADEQAIRDFNEACKRVDTNARERQRIRDIADLVDADDLIYGQALAAIDRGDHDGALPLLRRCADAGIGESAWLLATVLDELAKPEALLWYVRAAREGDPRAEARLAERHPPPALAPSDPDGDPRSRLLLPNDLEEIRAVLKALTALTALPPPTSLAQLVFCPDWRDDLLCHLARPPHALFINSCVATRGPSWDDRLPPVSNSQVAALVALFKDLPLPMLDHIRARRTPVTFAMAYHGAWLDGLSLAGGRCRSRRPASAPVPLLIDANCAWQLAATPEETATDVMLPLELVSTITPGSTVHDALEQMVRSGARALPVHDGADVAGVITLADIAEHMHRAQGLPSIQRVTTLMRPPVTVPAEMPLPAVMTTAASNPAGLLIVITQDGAPAGYLTHETLLARAPGARQGANTRSGLILPANSNPTAADRHQQPGSILVRAH